MLFLSCFQLLEQMKNIFQIINLKMATYYTTKIIEKQVLATPQKSEYQEVLKTGKILNWFAFFSLPAFTFFA